MRRIFILILTLCSLYGFSQPIVNRAGQANTVSDARLRAQYNFFLPRYSDTSAANLQKGIDTAGAIISTFNNKLWKRSLNPKRWEEIGAAPPVIFDSIRVRVDSIFIYRSDTVYYVGKFDSTSFLNAVNQTFVTSTRKSNDSVYYVINGVSHFSHIDEGLKPGDSLAVRRDSIFIYTRDTSYFIGKFDSTSLVNAINTKVDSVTFNRANGIDTVKYWINGTSHIAGYVPRKDGLISGGVVTWVSGLTFEVSEAVYSIGGAVYSSPTTQITLNTADPTNPRIDVIGVNTSGAVVKITGTAAVNPAEPQPNPATQLGLTSIYIAAAATTPTGVTQTTVYDENIEWTTSATAGITASFASTALAKNGTKSIAVSSFSSGGALRFTNSTTVSRSNYTALKFWVYLTTAWTTQDIYVQFFNGNRSVSDQQRAIFTKSSTGGWQSASLNLSQFAFTSATFDRIQLTFSGSSSSALYVDYLVLQGGITQGGGFTETDPIYTANGVPKTTTISINGVTQDLSTNRSWTISTGSGGTLNNVGTGYDVGVQGTSNVKRVQGVAPILLDSSTANTVKILADTGRGNTQIPTGYDLNKVRDSLHALILDTISVDLDTFIHKTDTINKWVNNATLSASGDSLVVYKNGVRTATKITGAGSSSTPASDQTLTVSTNGQTAFTFTGLPATKESLLLTVNGGVFTASDFSLSGNTITVTATDLAIGDKVTIHFK